jgi:uncharacterized protein
LATSHLRQLVIAATLLVAIDAHVLVLGWLFGAVPALSKRRRLVLAVAVLFFLTAPIGRLCGAFYWKRVASSLTAIGTTEWMLVMLAAIPIALLLIASRGVAFMAARHGAQRLEGSTPDAPPATGSEGLVTRRIAVERALGLTAIGVSGAALGWGAVIGRHDFLVEEVVVRLPGLPRALDGYTIAQISDIHAGLFVGDRELAEGFDKVRGLRPDLVVVTGDLLDFDAGYADWLGRQLALLRGKDGVVGILGNHDYYAGFKLVLPAMRAAGVDMLVNEGRVIRPKDGGGFALLGVDDLWASRSGGKGPDLARAISMVPPDLPRVLLAHQPSFVEMAEGQVGLQLSGHTHGGQINPGFRPADWLLRYVAGRYTLGATTMWVNRGFGVAGPPSRIGAPPEVTKVVLVSS